MTGTDRQPEPDIRFFSESWRMKRAVARGSSRHVAIKPKVKAMFCILPWWALRHVACAPGSAKPIGKQEARYDNVKAGTTE